MLVRITSVSGLKINFDKTSAGWLQTNDCLSKEIQKLDFYHIWSLSGILPHSKSLAFTSLQI